MALVEGRMSTLNPNAPLFVPAAFRQVEDFSPQWWELVKTSTWFRDYWLSEHQEDIFANDEDDVFNPWQEDVEDELTDVEAQFEDLVLWLEAEETIKSAGIPARKDVKLLNGLELNAKTLLKDLDLPKSPKGKGPRSPLGSPKYHDKPVKYVTPKCTPRKIHQIHQPR